MGLTAVHLNKNLDILEGGTVAARYYFDCPFVAEIFHGVLSRDEYVHVPVTKCSSIHQVGNFRVSKPAQTG